MSCAPKYGSGVSNAFGASSDQPDILFKPLYSIVFIDFFLFWVRLWVREYRAAQNLIWSIQRRNTKTKSRSWSIKAIEVPSNTFFPLLLSKLQRPRLSRSSRRCKDSPAKPPGTPVSPCAPCAGPLTISATPTINSENRGYKGKAGESPGAFCAGAIHFRPQCGRLRERGLTLFCPKEFLIDACFRGKAEKCRCYGISADAIVKTAESGG